MVLKIAKANPLPALPRVWSRICEIVCNQSNPAVYKAGNAILIRICRDIPYRQHSKNGSKGRRSSIHLRQRIKSSLTCLDISMRRMYQARSAMANLQSYRQNMKRSKKGSYARMKELREKWTVIRAQVRNNRYIHGLCPKLHMGKKADTENVK